MKGLLLSRGAGNDLVLRDGLARIVAIFPFDPTDQRLGAPGTEEAQRAHGETLKAALEAPRAGVWAGALLAVVCISVGLVVGYLQGERGAWRAAGVQIGYWADRAAKAEQSEASMDWVMRVNGCEP